MSKAVSTSIEIAHIGADFVLLLFRHLDKNGNQLYTSSLRMHEGDGLFTDNVISVEAVTEAG